MVSIILMDPITFSQSERPEPPILETLIYNICQEGKSAKNYGHTSISQALATVPVAVTEPGTGTRFTGGSSTGKKFSSGRVLV